MNEKMEQIIKLRNLIYELIFDPRATKDKKERINALKDELDELQHSLDLEIYNEDSKPALNF